MLILGSSESLLATTRPAVTPPTMMKLAEEIEDYNQEGRFSSEF